MEALEAEQLKETLLIGLAAGKPDGDGRAALATAIPGNVHDAFDLGKGLEESTEGGGLVGGGSPNFAMEEGAEQQGEDAVRSMDADLLIGPMVSAVT